ncbi:MAG: hypothetical protein GX430_04955, partial [Treponema sp.]|nr:hypothetical protein [Treponema sp.]
MKRILNIAAAVLLAAAVLMSCDPGPAGLFAMLERETPKNKGTAAFNANTAAFVTRLGAHYYAGVGSTILRRLAAGGAWETIPDSGAPTGSIITAGVSDGTNLYVSYSPAAGSIRYTSDGTNWNDYVVSGLPAGEPVQNLLYMEGDNRLLAATQHSTGTSSSDYTTYYTLASDNGAGVFTAEATATDQVCGYPSSIAWDGTNYWISAGNTVFKGTGPGTFDADDTNVTTAGFSSTNPVLGVWYDSANSAVLAAATGKLWKLNTGGAYIASGTFGSAARR